MSDFDKYLLYRALHRKFTRPANEPVDFDALHAEAYAEYQAEQEEREEEWREAAYPDDLKNICFKESHEFAGRLTYVCDALDIKKREFLRRAVDDAIAKAEERITELLENEE